MQAYRACSGIIGNKLYLPGLQLKMHGGVVGSLLQSGIETLLKPSAVYWCLGQDGMEYG